MYGVCVCLSVSVCDRALKVKRLELSTPNSVHIYSTAGTDVELKRSKVKVAALEKVVSGVGRVCMSIRGEVLFLL